jgi:hypothetical protein
MKLFKKDGAEKRRDREHEDAVSNRMRMVLSKDTVHEDDAATVESRLRNMNYGTSRR